MTNNQKDKKEKDKEEEEKVWPKTNPVHEKRKKQSKKGHKTYILKEQAEDLQRQIFLIIN